ncbi:MAG: hypothetical protein KZQ65_10565, partial [Candidatus Thiodiazotropha sp. (ex Gloverina cf. vestifex)]|nr:hypothetical protein [Candidatus Thiodiazotropha sp. (ex Gloverina cf. vestifex)]
MRPFQWNILAVMTAVVLLSASPLAAEDASDLKQLHATGECNGCNLEGVDLSGTDLKQACRYLVKDFGASESPKSTRQRDSRYAPTV